MGQRYLIDTNVIIDFSLNRIKGNGKDFVASSIDGEPHISVINKIELLGFSVVSQEIIDFIHIAKIIGLTDEIINQTIILRKEHRIKLPDAIIAASALIADLPLMTRNTKDFQQNEGLRLLNPHEIK